MIGVYPGKFDPATNGHLDLIRRAERLFERLIVAVYDLPDDGTLFSTDERVALLRETLGQSHRLTVEPFSGLLPEFVREQGADAIVRGLRAVTDFNVEFDQALMYKEMAPEIEQVYLMSDLRYVFVSATRIREVSKLGYDVSNLVPPPVAAALRRRFLKLA